MTTKPASESPAPLVLHGDDSFISPELSAAVVFGLHGALLLLVFVLLLRRSRAFWRRKRRAAELVGRDGPLEAGEAVLQGVVEYAAGVDQAVKISVDQEGSESESSGSWSHRWEETGRAVIVTPFYLRLFDGRRVRVEPDDAIELLDPLDGKVMVNRNQRILSADLVADEQVFVSGTLVRARDPEAEQTGYRGEGTELVLRPPKDVPMWLSSMPLGWIFETKARFFGRWAWAFFALFLLFQAFDSPYHVNLAAGEVHTGMVVRHWTEVEKEDGKPDQVTHKVEVETGATITSHTVSTSEHQVLTPGVKLKMLVTPWWPEQAQIGVRAGESVVGLLVGFWWIGGLFIWFWTRWRKERHWSHRQVVDSESGRLPEQPESA